MNDHNLATRRCPRGAALGPAPFCGADPGRGPGVSTRKLPDTTRHGLVRRCCPAGPGDEPLRPGWLGGPVFSGVDGVPVAGAFGPFSAGWFGGATVSGGVAGSFLVTGGAASEFGATGAAS